jgi:hypothetical protein
MATYIQLINVSLDNLADEQREWVEEMAQEHPNHFVEITDGDESLTREIMLDAIDADQVLYEGYARVVIDPGVNRADYELLSRYAEERHPGYHAGEMVLVMGAPITRPSMIPERTTVRLSENERHIVARILNQNPDMNQVFGRAISKALNDWNANNPQEEIVDEVTRVQYQFSEDSLFGGWEDMARYDTQASMEAYAQALETALSGEYPAAEIEVSQGLTDRVRVNGETSSGAPDLVSEVEEISGQVYEGYGWVRYTREGIDEALDTGLWCEYRSGYVASVAEGDEPGSYILTYHKGEMPAFETIEFSDIDALLDGMQTLCEFEDWQPRTE